MRRALLANVSPALKIVFSLLIILLAWFIFQAFALFSGIYIFKLDLNQAFYILNNLNDPSGVNFLKYVQGLTSIGLFIVSSFIIASFLDNEPLKFLYLKNSPDIKNIFLIFILIVIIQPFSNLMTEINESIEFSGYLENIYKYMENKEEKMKKIMETFLTPAGKWTLLVNIIVIALIPAIGEELIFRGVFQKLFISLFKNINWGIIITAFIFSALHLQFLSFMPRFILGLIFGYLVLWSNSLWPAIIAHFINNALAVIYFHFHYAGKIGNELELLGSPGYGLIYGIMSIFFSALIIYFIYINYKESDPKRFQTEHV